VETYYSKNPIEDLSAFKDDELKKRCVSAQIDIIRANIDKMPDKPLSYNYLAILYYNEGLLDEVVANLNKLPLLSH
jgi:hypothetical protein